MIEVKLKELAERLGKSITDISRETGLNRNTITDLYHNKVDGIKFATLEVLCDTYGVSLTDLIRRKETHIGAGLTSRVIRVDLKTTPFYYWHYLKAFDTLPEQYFDRGLGKVYAFFVRDSAELYFDHNELSLCAKSIYRRYEKKGLDELYSMFTRSSEQLHALHASFGKELFANYSNADLVTFYKRFSDVYLDFLRTSVFAEAFDYGFAEDIVGQITKAYSFSAKEAALLLAPSAMTETLKRRLALLQVAKKYVEKNGSKSSSSDSIVNFFAENTNAQQLLKDYSSDDSLVKEFELCIANTRCLDYELQELSSLPVQHRVQIKAILKKYRLKENPLTFFSTLATWKEEGGEINKKALYVFNNMLQAIIVRTHLTPAHAQYMLPEEVEYALKGLVNEDTLRARYERSIMLSVEHGDYQVSEGERAISIQDDLASRYMSYIVYANL